MRPVFERSREPCRGVKFKSCCLGGIGIPKPPKRTGNDSNSRSTGPHRAQPVREEEMDEGVNQCLESFVVGMSISGVDHV